MLRGIFEITSDTKAPISIVEIGADAKPWNINAKMEEYKKHREEENKNPGQLKLKYVGEITPKDFFEN